MNYFLSILSLILLCLLSGFISYLANMPTGFGSIVSIMVIIYGFEPLFHWWSGVLKK